MKKKSIITAALLVFGCCSFALAQDEHAHSDIEFVYDAGAIKVVEPEEEEGSVAEGEFGEGEFANFAGEPGIASEVEEGGGVNPGNIIGFNVLANLFYWDGSQVAPAGDATITIAGAGGAGDTVISAGSGFQPVDFSAPANLLGQADSEGDFHVDPGYTVSDGAAAGGYGLILSLASNDSGGIADSDPFGIFLNFGLEEEAFEMGVGPFAEAVATVPEPTSIMLVFFGLAGLGVLRRKR